jgi:hypothetical protein
LSFVDTNVLVHATARAALSRLAVDEALSISRQILREYIAVMH